MAKEKEVLDYAKDYFMKNSYVLVFNILAVVSFLFALFNYLNVNLKISSLVQLTSVFSVSFWIFLGLMFIISGVLAFYEKKRLMFLPIMIWLLVVTVSVRTSNMPLLKNAATGDWELGPDLDPYLYLRNAQEILGGRNLGETDEMRYAPLGAPSFLHANMMPWAIVFVYKVINLFGNYSLTYAAIISPVIFFVLSLSGFFLFVYFLFSFRFSKEKSLIGATVASFFYSFVPTMLHRTVAGIPEIESLGMVWFWLAFLFFTLAWKSDNKKKMITFGLLAGLFTGAMSWTWGGYRYIYMTIALASFLVFLFEKDEIKNRIIFSSWMIPSVLIDFIKGTSFSALLLNFSDTGFAIGVFCLIILSFVLFHTTLNKKMGLVRLNLPKSIITLILAFLIVVLGLLVIKPDFFLRIIDTLLYPFGKGRVGLTVAENKAPYFTEVLDNFGYLFWLFFFGIILLFYKSVKHFDIKNKIVLNFSFILFLSTFIFSSISPQHILNGNNFISHLLYFGGLIVFVIIFVGMIIKAHRGDDRKTLEDFKKVDVFYLLLIAFSFWAIVSMRGTVRLFFIIAPILILLAAYLPLRLSDYFNSKDKIVKYALIGIFVLFTLLFISVGITYSYATTTSARQIAPSIYNQQWQKAMFWVSQNTPENSIFVHWWDYGYWVQTLGKRPTVSDGGHYLDWWDHTIGRYLLTTPKPETARSLLKTHNVSYLLIDSTDLGKYSAYSSIGSDATGSDRMSGIPVIVSDPKQTQETSDGIVRVYPAGSLVDKDIILELNGTKIFLPEGKSALIGVILKTSDGEEGRRIYRPEAVFVYNNQQYRLPIRYVYYKNKITDFGSGLNITISLIPQVYQTNQGIQIDDVGALIYLSEKTMNSLFAELYLMDDPYNKYPTIELAYSQDDYVVESLKQQGSAVGDFVYYQGFRGPIKIWDTREIPENVLVREEFLYAPAGWSQISGPFAALDNLEFVG